MYSCLVGTCISKDIIMQKQQGELIEHELGGARLTIHKLT